MKTYYVYILTNRSGTLYVGMTNDLYRRLQEHRDGVGSAFTMRYKIDLLVYFEDTTDVRVALEREKHVKGWTRARKLELIKFMNPTMRDLSEDWAEPVNTTSKASFSELEPVGVGAVHQTLRSIAQGGISITQASGAIEPEFPEATS